MSATAALSETGNDRIVQGGNNPPAFEAHKANIDDLRTEAAHWLDGGKIASAEEAEAVDALLDMARQAGKAADIARAEEKEPHLKAEREIDAKWKPLITSAKTIAEVCKEALTPWRQAEHDRKEAEAARIRAEAAAKREAEIAATRAAAGNLEAREQADQLAASAKQAERAAKSAEKAASTGLGLRTVRSLSITDPTALAKWLWQHHRPQVEEAHAAIARRIWNTSAPALPGTEVHEDHKAV